MYTYGKFPAIVLWDALFPPSNWNGCMGAWIHGWMDNIFEKIRINVRFLLYFFKGWCYTIGTARFMGKYVRC